MTTWTDAKITKLNRLWEQGEPTEAIGEKLGCSKGAVIGKVHRLNLKPRRVGRTGNSVAALLAREEATLASLQERAAGVAKRVGILRDALAKLEAN